MLAGLIRDEERRVMDGIPGLSDIPVIGRIFAYSKNETVQSDVILTLTPHIVRVLDLNEDDLRPFRVGRDLGTSVIERPAPVEPARPAQEPQAPVQPVAPPPAPAAPPAAATPD